MHRRRPESHAIHTYFRLGKALLTESWHRAGIVLRMRGYRIVAIRLICVLVAVAGALLSPPAVAEPLPFDTLCHSVTGPGTADSALPTLPIARSEEQTYEHQSLMRISYAVFCLQKKRYTASYLKKKT